MQFVFLAIVAVGWPLYEYLDQPPLDEGSRRRTYLRAIGIQWLLAFACPPIAVSWPAGARLWAAGALTLVLAGLYARQAIATARTARLQTAIRALLAKKNVAAILPHNAAELALFVALSITAGFTEELLFRGFVLSTLATIVGWWTAAGIAIVPFAFLHSYQGASGMVRTAVVGAALTLVVAATRSLVPAMALHALIDIGSGVVSWIALASPSDASLSLRAGAETR